MEDIQLKDFATPDYFENPYTLYERIRERGTLVPAGPNIAVTVDFALCEAMLSDRRLGRALHVSVGARYGETGMKNPVFQVMTRMFGTLNPPEHTRARALVAQAFRASQVEVMRDMMQRTADELIDALPEDGEFDLMKDFAHPLPVNIICQMLGLPVEEGLRFGEAAATFASAFDVAPLDAAGLARVNEAVLTLQAYFQTVVEERRRGPGSDLISALVAAEVSGERLSDDEIVANVLLLFVAGHETTSNTLCNALLALHRHPDQLRMLGADLSLVPQAIAECMRYDGSVHTMVRVALEDATIQGAEIPAGTLIFVVVGGANRDPGRFANPNRLDIRRPDNGRQLFFGGGIHYCLGARLAQTEMEIALRTLLQRLPRLALKDVEHPRWRQRGSIRGVEALAATRG